MRRAGVLRIRDFSELYTAAATLGAGVRVRGRRLAIVSNAGGPGTIAADRAQDRGLKLAELGAASLQRLAEELPPAARPGNPVYVRPDVDGTQFAAAARTCLEDPDVDSLLAILVPHALTDPDVIAASLIQIAKDSRKPVFTCWMGGESVEASRQQFAAHKVPSYVRPETAVDAVAALGLYASNQQLLLQVPEPLAPTSAPDRARAQACHRRGAGRGSRVVEPGGIQGSAERVRDPDRAQPAGALGGRGGGAGPRSGLAGGDEDPVARHRAQDRRRRCRA